MSLRNLILFGLAASALLSLFAVGLKASLQDATYLFRRPGELVRALLAMNVLMPLFAIALISIFDFTPAVRIALVGLSLSPIPPPVPAKEVKSGGSASYVMGLHVAIGLLAIIFVPLAMAAIGQVRGVALHTNIARVALVVFVSILIPIGAGIFVHTLAPAFAERIAKPLTSISALGLAACIIVVWIASAPAMWLLMATVPSSHSRHLCSSAWQSVTFLAAPHLRIELRWPLRLLHVTPESHSYWPKRTFLRRHSSARRCSYTCSSMPLWRSPIFSGPNAGNCSWRARGDDEVRPIRARERAMRAGPYNTGPDCGCRTGSNS